MSKQNNSINVQRPPTSLPTFSSKRTKDISVSDISGTGIESYLAGSEQNAIETLVTKFSGNNVTNSLNGLYGTDVDIGTSVDINLRDSGKTEKTTSKRREDIMKTYELIQETINRVDKRPKHVIINV